LQDTLNAREESANQLQLECGSLLKEWMQSAGKCSGKRTDTYFRQALAGNSNLEGGGYDETAVTAVLELLEGRKADLDTEKAAALKKASDCDQLATEEVAKLSAAEAKSSSNQSQVEESLAQASSIITKHEALQQALADAMSES